MSASECENFLAELRRRIQDNDLYNIVCSSFAIIPSKVKDADPDKLRKEAEEFEKREMIGNALHKFRAAAHTAFYRESVNVNDIWTAYGSFLKKHEELGKHYLGDITAYETLSKRSTEKQIIIGTYKDFLRSPEAGKKKS
jgi:hypothetical protein